MHEENAMVPMNDAEKAAMIPASMDALGVPVHSASAPPENRTPRVPYIGFRGKKSVKNTAALDAAGIVVSPETGAGVFYLHDVEPIKLKPCALHLIQYARFFTLTDDDDGMVTDAVYNTNNDLYDAGFREHLYGLVIAVRAPGQYTPATLQLQSAQCKALQSAIAFLGDGKVAGVATKDAEWGSRSAAHKATLPLKTPGCRFRTTIWSTLEKPQGKSQPYNLGHGTVAPTPADEVETLGKFLADSWPAIQLVATKYNLMVERTRRLANKQNATA